MDVEDEATARNLSQRIDCCSNPPRQGEVGLVMKDFQLRG